MPIASSRRTLGYKPALFWFCVFALAWITALLFAGGFTTSIKAGMAFLDWPLSDGSINPEGWLTEQDKMAEHSHRLLGMKVGLLSIAIWIWVQRREARRWVRVLAAVLVGAVIVQGLMGGARVRFDWLNTGAETNSVAQSFAVAHACGAQLVLLCLLTITLANTRRWIDSARTAQSGTTGGLAGWGIVATAGIFLQILAGAVMRHADAGLAIPTFPLTPEGGLLPAYWSFPVTIHFIHRAGAVLVTVLLLLFLGRIWIQPAARRRLAVGGVLVMALLLLQIYLGALTVWSVKNPHAATLHMLVGAFLLASTWALTFFSFRISCSGHCPTGHDWSASGDVESPQTAVRT